MPELRGPELRRACVFAPGGLTSGCRHTSVHRRVVAGLPRHTQGITDACLERLPPNLSGLDLAECSSLRDFALLARLGALSSLSLDGCHVRPQQLLKICEACPLTSLNVGASQNVDDDVVAAVARLRPRLILDACPLGGQLARFWRATTA